METLDDSLEGLLATLAVLAVEERAFADEDRSVAGALERSVVVERRAVQSSAVVPDTQVALGPVIADLRIVRLSLQPEEVVEEGTRLVDRDAFDAFGESLVHV